MGIVMQVESSAACVRVKACIGAEIARLSSLLADFEAAEAALARQQEETRRQDGVVPLKLPARVKLNVGGKKFFVTSSGLRSQRGLLRTVCDGVGKVALDEEGCIFVDRSPLAFRFILNHLAGEPLRVDTMTQLEKETLLVDAEFYGLWEIVELLGGKGESGRVADNNARQMTEEDSNTNVAAVLTEAWKDLGQREAEFRVECAEAEQMKKKIAATFGGEKVKLQLRQEDLRFSTRVSTLVSRGGMLEAKFGRGGEAWRADVDESEGSVFVDKDGTSFELVLNMLRGYPVPKCLTTEQRKSFLHDLEYFALEVPVTLNASWTLTETPNAKLSDDKLTLERVGGACWNCATIGTEGWSIGVHTWSVEMGKCCEHLMFGVAPSNINRVGTNHFSMGFYMYSNNGTLYGQDSSKGKLFGSACCVEGSTMVVQLDCDAHTLSFGIDGQPLKVAYSGLPLVPLFPAFDIHTTGCTFTVKPEQRQD